MRYAEVARLETLLCSGFSAPKGVIAVRYTRKGLGEVYTQLFQCPEGRYSSALLRGHCARRNT